MTEFDAALDDLLLDAAIAEPAIYTPPAGASVVLRVVLAGPDERADLFLSEDILTRWRAMARVADIQAPVAGATLAIAGEDGTENAGRAFTVRGFQLDVEGLSWTLVLEEIS